MSEQFGNLRLTRGIGERIIINRGEEEVILTIENIENNYVILNIRAATHIPIDREEIRNAKNLDMFYDKN